MIIDDTDNERQESELESASAEMENKEIKKGLSRLEVIGRESSSTNKTIASEQISESGEEDYHDTLDAYFLDLYYTFISIDFKYYVYLQSLCFPLILNLFITPLYQVDHSPYNAILPMCGNLKSVLDANIQLPYILMTLRKLHHSLPVFIIFYLLF